MRTTDLQPRAQTILVLRAAGLTHGQIGHYFPPSPMGSKMGAAGAFLVERASRRGLAQPDPIWED